MRTCSQGLIAVCGLWAALAAGCANTFDAISSRRFRERPFDTMFSTPDPMTVLRGNSEGDERIRAMRAIKEPRTNGKSDTEQEELIQILGKTATSDSSGLCRVAAIDALGRFQDQRVPTILVTAYHNAPQQEPPSVANAAEPNEIETVGFRRKRFTQPRENFAPEDVTAIQCRSLAALGATRSPAGLTLLCEVATTPTPKQETKETLDLLNPLGEGVKREEVRIAAVRALGNYPGEPRAIGALEQIMQNEKDVVLRSRAQEALGKIRR